MCTNTSPLHSKTASDASACGGGLGVGNAAAVLLSLLASCSGRDKPAGGGSAAPAYPCDIWASQGRGHDRVLRDECLYVFLFLASLCRLVP